MKTLRAAAWWAAEFLEGARDASRSEGVPLPLILLGGALVTAGFVTMSPRDALAELRAGHARSMAEKEPR